MPRGYPRDHPRAGVLRRRSVAGGRRLGGPRGAGSRASGRWPTCATPGAPSAPVNAWLDRNVGAAEVDPRAVNDLPRSERLDAEVPDPVAHLDFADRQLNDPRVAPWHGGARPARASSSRCSPPSRAGGRGRVRAVVVARPLDRRAGRLRRAQPRRGRGRAGRRGRLVDRPGALGRGAGPRGGAGRARLGVRALRARADRLVHAPRQRALAAGDGEDRDELRREFERRGLPHLLYEIDQAETGGHATPPATTARGRHRRTADRLHRSYPARCLLSSGLSLRGACV